MLKYIYLKTEENIKKYVYTCITFKCHKTLDEAKNTKKYKKAVEIATALKIENIVIDICTSRNRHKHNLEKVLSTRGNTIVIPDITCLGQKDELFTVYQRIIQSENEILICYFGKGGVLVADKLSTVSLSFDNTPRLTPSEIELEFQNLTKTKFLSDSRRMFDPRIADAYWQVEKCEKTQMEVAKELGTSKSTFARKANEYIGSDEWYARYLIELENEEFKHTPTRLGEVTEDAKQLYEYLEANPDEIKIYDLSVVVSFAGIDLDTWNKIGELNASGSDLEERDRLTDRYDVMAHHLYRQVIKYRKYLKRLKYRQ